LTANEDPFALSRFVAAQAPVYERVVRELRGGRKTTHWIWFIFPQMRGLGRSKMAHDFGISSRAEAIAYLNNPVLGARLEACTRLVLAVRDKPLDAIMSFPDDLKFISSMTLFAAVAPDPAIYVEALARFAGGRPDAETLRLLETAGA
jgi:uncharacterized protein (DUF1810 family)